MAVAKTRKPAVVAPAAGEPAPREIRFYRANEKPYGAFSNLFPRPVTFEGRTYPTAEHAYQAGKPRNESVREWLLSAPTPALLAMAAHGLYTWDIVSNWSTIKTDRMRDVLRCKFTQHADLRILLLSTEDARLVEAASSNTPTNRFWGEVNGKGRNMLGRLLMDLRAEFRRKPDPRVASPEPYCLSEALSPPSKTSAS